MMSNAKHTPKRKRGAKAVPVLGAAGLLSLAGGASAATSGAPPADLPTQKLAPTHEIILGDEELSDVNLSTFYVFVRRARSRNLVNRLLGGAVAAAAAAVAAGGAVAAAAAAVVAAAGPGDVAATAKTGSRIPVDKKRVFGLLSAKF
jgi:hypothetical protein